MDVLTKSIPAKPDGDWWWALTGGRNEHFSLQVPKDILRMTALYFLIYSFSLLEYSYLVQAVIALRPQFLIKLCNMWDLLGWVQLGPWARCAPSRTYSCAVPRQHPASCSSCCLQIFGNYFTTPPPSANPLQMLSGEFVLTAGFIGWWLKSPLSWYLQL